MFRKYLVLVTTALCIAACASSPPAGFSANPEMQAQKRAAAIERNRQEAIRKQTADAKDPWRHMRPHEQR